MCGCCAPVLMSLALLLAGVPPARAQAEADVLKALAGLAPDLRLPAEVRDEVPAAGVGMAIYKPTGAGPFPALVVVHSCGGIREELLHAARDAWARGYVVLVLDALGPRGIQSVCVPSRANASVNFPRGTRDALQAMAHLARLPFVDAARIGLMGFSWGGSVGLLASGAGYALALSEGVASGPPRPAAVVAYYPLCFLPGRVTASGRDVDFVRPDHRPPALVLLAGQDNEAPPAECSSRLQALKDKGVPVEWHVYPEATHCWDCSSLDGLVKTDFQGRRVAYRFDRELAADALRRSFEFLDARLKPR